MNKLYMFLLTILNCVGQVFILLELLDVFEITFDPEIKFIIYLVWIPLCFTAAWWYVPLYLAGKRVRKPILEEEAIIQPLLKEVVARSNITFQPKLLLLEAAPPGAFATGNRIIVVSTSLVQALNGDELKAVLAHETGHLKCRDGLMGAAFFMATFPLSWCNKVLRKPRTKTRLKFVRFVLLIAKHLKYLYMAMLAAILIICYQLLEFVPALLILYGFYRLYPLLYKVENIAWFALCRPIEYKQDQFAQSLGYGSALKSGLLKLSPLDNDQPIERIIVLLQPHPKIADRVRRLEWLEGLRSDQ